jgi:RNA polymerase sigma-70 factor (ECF subfamily)
VREAEQNAGSGAGWAARLYDECAAELILYGRALGLARPEAEDVLHDTFRALLLLTSPPREPRFYLVRAFRNRAINRRRSLWRRLQRELATPHWFERESVSGEPAERAAVALQRLPADQREVIVLKLWHDMTFEAIGRMLGIPPNTAAGRYRYGLQKLRQLVHPLDHELIGESRGDAAWIPSAAAIPEA